MARNALQREYDEATDEMYRANRAAAAEPRNEALVAAYFEACERRKGARVALHDHLWPEYAQ